MGQKTELDHSVAKATDNYNRILTVPNLLSAFRLLLLPLIIWLYLVKREVGWTAAVLVLSGLTDTLDGFLARRYSLVTKLGTALDPIADKLTQISVLMCLLIRFRTLRLPTVILVCKELLAGVQSLVILRKKRIVAPAEWHGKLCTWMLYITMIVHVLWSGIPEGVSFSLAWICVIVLLLSAVLYTIRNIRLLRD